MAKTTLIDFWAVWCGPCKIMEPVIEELEKELGDKIEVQKVNVDDEPEKASKFGVMGIPTYVVLKDGKEVGRKVGVVPKLNLKNYWKVNSPWIKISTNLISKPELFRLFKKFPMAR